jgi:hypothetical protein
MKVHEYTASGRVWTMTDQSHNELKAAVDRAWADLNELASELPECGHVRRWHADIAAAKKEHQRALRAYKKAARA